jgi:hypothetical protein
MSPSWVDELAAQRATIDPSASGDHMSRQHNAAVLRVASTRITTGDGITQVPTAVADWLHHLANDADRQADLWLSATELLRTEATDFARDGDNEVSSESVIDRLQDRANAISLGRLSL